MMPNALINLHASVLLIIISISAQLSATPPSHNFTVAKPNCVDRCGEISIPFPFGTTEECYQSYSFWVTCNDSFNPPRLFSQNSSIEITHISLSGQITFLQFIAKDCYARNGTGIFHNSPWIQLATYLTVNNTANKFTIVGCDAYAFVSGQRLDRSYMTGCTAMCNAVDDLMEGFCLGVGCCQTPIPEDVSTVDLDLRSYSNYSDVWDFNSCGYAFLVEETAFTFSWENLTNLQYVDRLPMVVDWAIGNGTCDEAEVNAASYACLSSYSECYKPENGYGYRCRCLDGFEGSPYLNDGCYDIDECAAQNDCMEEARCLNTVGNYTCTCPKGYSGNGRGTDGCADIDECAESTQHDCISNEYCTNTIGNYTCSCPKGYSGNGRGLHGCSKEHYATPYVLIGIAFGIIAFLVGAILWYLELKRRTLKKTKQKFFCENGGILLQEKLTTRQRSPDMVKIFSSSELHRATDNFHSSMIIGQGGFGTVYKGELSDKSIVAIKKSKKVDPNQIEQFINEVFVLSQVNHRNVVRLLGCCLETEVPLLVYEFISNGALSAHIHNQAKACFLNWETRLKIAAETAGVLSYLHSAASTPIIHRDVKSDNILLDQDFTAKVSDFGASKLVPLDLTQLSTMVQGTFGYLDPEYMQTNQLTEKSDVYSFGVVLLELLTGRKAISFDKAEQEKNLANFFLSMLSQERLCEILDENIVGDTNMEQISKVARVAKECLNVKGENRPSMKEVAMELEGLILRGKHSWARTGKVEEMRSLLDEEGLMNLFANIGEENGTNTTYNSIRGHVFSPVDGGR